MRVLDYNKWNHPEDTRILWNNLPQLSIILILKSLLQLCSRCLVTLRHIRCKQASTVDQFKVYIPHILCPPMLYNVAIVGPLPYLHPGVLLPLGTYAYCYSQDRITCCEGPHFAKGM